MKYTIQYEICLDEDYPNTVDCLSIQAENEEEAIKKFYEMGIFKSVVTGVWETK